MHSECTMQEQLHDSILDHARHVAEVMNVSLAEAIEQVAKQRPRYFNNLPLFSRPRERRPPFSVTPHLVRGLNAEAKRLRKRAGIQLAAALDACAFQAGFHDWKHVMKMANDYLAKVEEPVKTGFAFALWYPQNPWDDKRWDPSALAPAGLIHDPRLFFSTAAHLKHCYTNEDAEGGFYGLGYPVAGEDGSVVMYAEVTSYLDELRADVYAENNLPDLHFFRYAGAGLPETLDDARALLEAALGPVRWNIAEPSFPPEPVSISDALEAMKNQPAPPAPLQLPAIGDRSNVHLHIPIVHYAWLRGAFVELDYYYF